MGFMKKKSSPQKCIFHVIGLNYGEFGLWRGMKSRKNLPLIVRRKLVIFLENQTLIDKRLGLLDKESI